MTDPSVERFRKKFPQFPGVQTYCELLAQPNVRGTWVDLILGDLQDRAPDIIEELIEAFKSQPSQRVQILLLSVIAEAGLPRAHALLVENLRASDESLRHWAIQGLALLGTKEARQALWDARSYTFASPDETEKFRRDLIIATPRKAPQCP